MESIVRFIDEFDYEIEAKHLGISVDLEDQISEGYRPMLDEFCGAGAELTGQVIDETRRKQ